jgi:hypothetical protein
MNSATTKAAHWFIAEIVARPLSWNYNRPIRVGIEAYDREHASQRLKSLYSDSRYMSRSYSCPNIVGGLDSEPAKDADQLNGSNLHPLPTSL